MRFYLALWFAKILNFLIQIIDKNKGSNFSGAKALKIDPQMVSHFKGIDYAKILFITGTNGKSSTTHLINHLLAPYRLKIITNLEGANLLPGIATSLSKAANWRGYLDYDYMVFETDERYLPLIYEQLPAEHLLITNLQKDQVQRNGDPDFIVRKIKQIMNPKLNLYLNNEDPRSKAFEDQGASTFYYSVAKHEETFRKPDSFPSLSCPKCAHGIQYTYFNVDNIGDFHCDHCGFSSQENPDARITDINFKDKTFKKDGIRFPMPYDLPYMLYNYAGALLIMDKLFHEEITACVPVFDDFKNIAGRFEKIPYGQKTIKYMRIKQENPDTLQNTLNVIAQDPEPKAVCIGLYPVEDIVPYYTNTFYTYDCDFGPMVAANVEQFLCFSPVVAYDTANRLIYEGVPKEKLYIQPNGDFDEMLHHISEMKTDNIYLITCLASYDELNAQIQEKLQ